MLMWPIAPLLDDLTFEYIELSQQHTNSKPYAERILLVLAFIDKSLTLQNKVMRPNVSLSRAKGLELDTTRMLLDVVPTIHPY